MKKRVEIIGDSMLNNIEETAEGEKMPKSLNTRIYPHSGLKSIDMVDLVKVTARRQPDAVIIHVGSNDFNDPAEKIDAVGNLEATFKHLRKVSPKTEIAFSTILHRYDQQRNLEAPINQLNGKIAELCKQYNVDIVSNDSIDATSLGQKLWHPNFRGKKKLASHWLDDIHHINRI